MFRCILVALCDVSQSSHVTQQAIWVARRERARLLGLYVVDEDELVPPTGTEGITPNKYRAEVEPELRASGKVLLDGFAQECALADVPAETRLLVGSVAKTICRQGHTADLIVVGRCGDYARRSSILGCCILEGVVRQASRPVLAVAPEPRHINRVLMAYDGSMRASAALAEAARLASDWQVPLVLATVVERNVDRRALLEGCEYLKPYGLPEDALLLEGTPADEILRAAREHRADLLVVGAYCHDRMREAVFGGTVGRLLREADCPVLIGC